jgi:hypothetical protein
VDLPDGIDADNMFEVPEEQIRVSASDMSYKSIYPVFISKDFCLSRVEI